MVYILNESHFVKIIKNSNKKEIMERVKNQLNDEYKIKNSDFLLNNNEEELILPQILLIHNNLLNILKKK